MIRVGQKLAQERQKKGLSLADVEQATKIKSSFLASIERGEYHQLPSPSYVPGFVKNYVEFLGLPVRETMAVFRREFDEEKAYKVLPDSLAKGEELSSFRFRIRRRILLVILFLLLFAGYLLFQYRYAIISPPLTVNAPKEGMTTTREVVVTGKTDPSAVVTVNNEAIAIDDNGEFAKRVTVFPGASVITITAKNRVKKETKIERHIIASE